MTTPEQLITIEQLALIMMKAKGRYHAQLAACELSAALGLPVAWPDKNANHR